MHVRLGRFIRDQGGATAVEYGLILALVSVGIILAAIAIGGSLEEVWNRIVEFMGD